MHEVKLIKESLKGTLKLIELVESSNKNEKDLIYLKIMNDLLSLCNKVIPKIQERPLLKN